MLTLEVNNSFGVFFFLLGIFMVCSFYSRYCYESSPEMSLENQNEGKWFPPVKNRLIFHCAFNFYLQVRLFPLHIGSSLTFAQSY